MSDKAGALPPKAGHRGREEPGDLARYHGSRDLLALAALGLFAAARSAATQSTIAVSASVSGSCTIGSEALAFGAYSPGTTASKGGALTVRCTNGVPFSIALNNGLGAAGRRMTGPGGTTLPYEIYSDSGHSRRWDGGSDTQGGVGTGADQAFPFFGVISPSPALAGDYSDIVTANLTY